MRCPIAEVYRSKHGAPDHAEGQDYRFFLEAWFPTLTRLGLAVVQTRPELPWNPAESAPGIWLPSNVDHAGAALKRYTKHLPNLYGLLGFSAWTVMQDGIQVQTAVRYPHGQVLANRLANLSGLVETVGFWPCSTDGKFTDQEGLSRLKNDGKFCMAASGKYGLHDTLVHATTQLLMDKPLLGDHQLTAEWALAGGDYEMKHYMGIIDTHLNDVHLGSHIGDALDADGRLPTPVTCLSRWVEGHWEMAAATTGVTSTRTRPEMALSLRNHICQMELAAMAIQQARVATAA